MNNLVQELVKVDLHIHSFASEKKDGKKVEGNTLENVGILMKKLKENKVDMISITDHNCFNIKMYDKVKKYEGTNIKKLLPGVEFDVEFKGEKIHIITIFNDNDYEKIKLIPQKINKPFDNKDNNAYVEKTFKEMLKDIDISVLLIAHQKSGVRASNQNDNLAKIGEKEFDNIIGVDYFDAIEFRSGKVEGILNDYKYEKQLLNLRYITGTDCHVWNNYPQQDETDKTDIKYSYIKSLPTFKGLVMALTEPHRVTTAQFEVPSPFISKLGININGVEKSINLSPGLNAIIGDNSIGKSLIIETLIDPKYSKIKEKSKRDGYKAYLKAKKIKIKSFEKEELNKIQYDPQGGIRERFQNGTQLLDVQLFKSKFKKLDTTNEFEEIYLYADKLLNRIENNQNLFDKNNELDFEISIPSEVENSTYLLRVVDNLDNIKKDYVKITEAITLIKRSLTELCEIEEFSDFRVINVIIKKLDLLYEKYNIKSINENYKYRIKSCIKEVCKTYEEKNNAISETQENKLTQFKQDIILSSKKICDYIKALNIENKSVLEDFKPIKIKEADYEEGKYKFVTSTAYKIIEKKDMDEILTMPLSNIKSIDKAELLNSDDFNKKLKKTLKDGGDDSKEKYRNSVSEFITSKYLKQGLQIYRSNQKLEQGNSPGKNALIYLDIIADEKSKKLYIVDQPDDDISHIKLTHNVIDILRRMGDSKQVLFITHKPELVVNLDVDNVIILKEENNTINILNGTLEYENEKKGINILKDVADILDGGEETIRKRWKRYDK